MTPSRSGGQRRALLNETLTKGKRLDDIAGTWCRYFQLDLAPQRLEDAILQRITRLIAAKGEPMRGVQEALRYFREAGL